jgi:radical SAM superfamily enzyme YgiQ (UPF0313 family)
VRIDLYHLYREFHFSKLTYPIVLDVLRVWSERSGVRARVAVCKERQVDLDTDAAVVGISVYTQTAPAAYRVGAALRRRGKIVVFGGPHFRGRSTYEEAAPYCDAVVSSTSERQWLALLGDVTAGRLRAHRARPLWISDEARAFRYPDDFYQAIRSRRWYQAPTIPTTVGCPYDCDFCSAYMQGTYQLRNVRTIRDEVAYARGPMVIFCDATFGLHKRFTIELMDAVAPLGKKIAVETTLSRLRDRETLDALARGGVKWLVVGIESLSTHLKKHGRVGLGEELRDVLDAIHERGMLVQGNFICGLDEDGPDSFENVYRYYERSTLDAIMMGILTPYPHTPLYERLATEGRIFDRDWEHYDCHHVVYRPKRMTVDELIEGYLALYRSVRRHRSIVREVLDGLARTGLRTETAVMIGNNLYQKWDSRKKERQLRQNQRELAASEAPGSGSTGVRSALPSSAA